MADYKLIINSYYRL